MKPPKHVILSKFTFALIITSLMMIMVASAGADPTVQTLDGKTCVQLDEDFADFLGEAEISLDIIEPALVRWDRVCFPIVGGAFDLGDLRGEASHTGGLGLTQDVIDASEDKAGEDEAIAEEKVVELISFIIDTSEDAPVLTGLVIIDGNLDPLFARLPLFQLLYSDDDVEIRDDKLIIRNVVLKLTQQAAFVLNNQLDAEFMPSQTVGVAKVLADLFRGYYYGCKL